MEDKMKERIISVFNEHILSPVIYMEENDDIVDLICFCDRNILMGDLYAAQSALRNETGRRFEIIDIREFDMADRLDVMKNAELIYSEDRLVERIFERSILEDFETMQQERSDALVRYGDTSSPYAQ